jgi:hypothetical protein
MSYTQCYIVLYWLRHRVMVIKQPKGNHYESIKIQSSILFHDSRRA